MIKRKKENNRCRKEKKKVCILQTSLQQLKRDKACWSGRERKNDSDEKEKREIPSITGSERWEFNKMAGRQ